MSDHRHVRNSKPQPAPEEPVPHGPIRTAAPVPPTDLSDDTVLAIEIRSLVEHGAMDAARERFADLVATHQRRAVRIAYQYLRDGADADEAVQDAFFKVFTHIASYREAWPFEVWFTRILINGCLDRRKARARRERWFVASDTPGPPETATETLGGVRDPDPEERLLARERRGTLTAAIDRLDGRQRTVFMLCHYGDCSPREVSAMTGINESTVRVHLFRAVRKLRGFLGGTS
ncbi:MAG TPA: sigma-70 family RNA polymerase sigma factor [Vicinamibacterales bacterium]|nr:sigma-70 family RNA polymerase sigma factor [Vicinamibacterales bacterium]